MTTNSLIDLASLPIPDAVEVLDFETIYATRKADLIALYPEGERQEIAATLELESEPITKHLQESSYRELVWRQRVNDAIRAVMLAYAEKGDLDNVVANLGVQRLVISPADDSTTPPTPAVMESDSDLRARAQLSFQGYTTAGSAGSYKFHALSADGKVKDALPTSPAAGKITVFVLSRDGDGTADDALLKKVKDALNVEIVRPMNDDLDVLSASIVHYTVEAELELFEGPDADTVVDAAEKAMKAYASAVHYMGFNVARSGIDKALHQTGVSQVNLTQPSDNIVMSDGQAAYCTSITITTKAATNG